MLNNILAINTAFKTTNIALESQNTAFFDDVENDSKKSESLLVLVDNILQKANQDVCNINTFAVVVGPGSFTGLRVSLAMVKGFCKANKNAKVLPICSLDLMAHIFAKQAQSNFCCIINALSGYVFACDYNQDGSRLSQPQMLESMDQTTLPTVGLKNDLPSNFEVCLTSESLLEFAKQNQNLAMEEDKVELVYLRKSQAEADLDKRTCKK